MISSHSYAELSVEEKVGQLIIAHFNGEIANEEALRLINDAHVGGIIYYKWANSLCSPEQVQRLSISLQKLTLAKQHPIPLLIAVDQEGGTVNRLQEGFTAFPGNEVLGLTKNPALAEATASAISQELLAVGVNVNFAPVVDIRPPYPSLSVLGSRAYGSTPEEIVSFGNAALNGFKKRGLITTLKHFPGLGDALLDPHQGLPILDKALENLQKREFIPFDKLKEHADMIMTAHLLVPQLDPLHCATFSKPILDILRHHIGFKGVIISDSLIMQGALDNGGEIEESALKAFLAGCDILLLGGKQLLEWQTGLELTVDDVIRVHKHLVSKVTCGEISEERLNASVQRILNLKKSHGLFQYSFPNPDDILKCVHTKEHVALAEEIAIQ